MLARVALWTCNQMERHTSALMNVRSVMIAQRAIKMTAPTAAENWFGALGEAFILRAKKRLLQKSKSRIGPACFGSELRDLDLRFAGCYRCNLPIVSPGQWRDAPGNNRWHGIQPDPDVRSLDSLGLHLGHSVPFATGELGEAITPSSHLRDYIHVGSYLSSRSHAVRLLGSGSPGVELCNLGFSRSCVPRIYAGFQKHVSFERRGRHYQRLYPNRFHCTRRLVLPQVPESESSALPSLRDNLPRRVSRP